MYGSSTAWSLIQAKRFSRPVSARKAGGTAGWRRDGIEEVRDLLHAYRGGHGNAAWGRGREVWRGCRGRG